MCGPVTRFPHRSVEASARCVARCPGSRQPQYRDVQFRMLGEARRPATVQPMPRTLLIMDRPNFLRTE